MKLKSCFLITLMVCAFFSCSDNDDPVNLTITPVVPDATLSMAVQTDAKTKGGFINDGEASVTPSWDFQVKTLTAVVFNNGAYSEGNIPVGSIAAIFTQNYANPSDDPIIEGEVKSGDVFLLLIANLEPDVLATLTSSVNSSNPNDRLVVAEVLKQATSLSNEGMAKGLTMSSDVKSLEIVPGINFVGFGPKGTLKVEGIGTGTEIYGSTPVDLVRTVAAINLTGVLLPETPDSEKPEYKNVSFTLDSVFVANVKSKAGIGTLNPDVTTIEQSAIKADGTLDTDFYLAPEKYATRTGKYKTGNAKGDDAMLCVLSGAKKIDAEAGTNKTTTTLDWTNTTEVAPCYVYPNQNGETGVEGRTNYTLLVLRGTYEYSIAGKKEIEPNRYFTVIVNDDSLGGEIVGENGKTNVHIQRNTKYNITVQILGSGSDDPFTPAAFAHVAAQIKVANWNVIEIDQPVD